MNPSVTPITNQITWLTPCVEDTLGEVDDSVMVKKVTDRIEKKIMDKAESNVTGLSDKTIEKSVLADPLTLKRAGQLTQKAVNQVRNVLNGHPELPDKVLASTQRLKLKYDYLPNSTNLETARNRNSLHGQSFISRLSISGNYNISQLDPLLFDLSPSVGYRLNRKIEMGTIYNVYRKELNNQSAATASSWGCYLQYLALSRFFLQGEYHNFIKIDQEINDAAQVDKLLLGAGYEISVSHRVKIQSAMFYRIDHDNSELTSRGPLTFRTGVKFTNIGSGKGLKKLKY